ncbi:MAG: radical SAM protein [Candidatus Diapherotrites archaeon]
MGKKTEVAFISPASRSMTQRPPHAYLTMASYLEEKGIPAEIIESKGLPEKKSEEDSLKKLERLSPKIVGVSCLTPEVLEVRALVKKINGLLPDATVLAGGVHATLIPKDLLFKGSGIDFVILGEGEETMLEFAQKALKGSKAAELKKVKGIAWLQRNKVGKSAARPIMPSLAHMPIPMYEKIDMDYYTKPDVYCIRGVPISGFYIFTSRGCPFRCEFCVNKNIFGRNQRYKDPVKVVEEIELLKDRYRIDGFYVYDDTFTVNRKHVEKICDEMLERKLGMIWGCETRVNLVWRDLMQKMKKAGCVQIDFGVESGSPENLIRLKKDITVPQTRDAFKTCKQLGIRTFANFMINTPEETEEDVRLTIDLAKELDANVSIFNVTTPYPGTGIYDRIGGVPLEDYKTLAPNPTAFKAWISMIESKYKFSKHKMNLEELLESLSKEFPSLHHLSFGSPKHMMRFLNNVSFLFSPRYLSVLLKSKRKKQYVKWFLSVGKFLKEQKNVEADAE